MQYRLSKKVTSLEASAIREILKHTGEPGVISLAAGSPSAEAFPIDKLRDISKRLLDKDPILALQYNITEGYTPLRDQVKKRLASMGCFNPDRDELIITSGAQQGNELTCKVMCDFGESMATESPSFIGSLNSFRSYGVNLHGITMHEDGLDIDELEKTAKENDIKVLYIIPNFQNPTGYTTSWAKRKAVYELAKKYEFIVLEDNPYGDLRFEGEPINCIKSLDEDGLVVYAGTFSKILAPGLRVGYISGPKEIIQKCVVCKQVADVHTNIWAQLMCYHFMDEVNLDEHLEKLRKVYRRKCNLMDTLLHENLADGFEWTKPQGGMFIWVKVPDEIDAMEFSKRAMDEYKVAIVPGSAFAINNEKLNYVRLNFSTPSDEDITKGIEALGKLTKNYKL